MALSIREYLERGPATSKEIQIVTGLGQTTVSRQLSRMGDCVIRLQNRRPPNYVLTTNAFGADDKLPLYMIDTYGNNTIVANLRPLAHGGFFVEQFTGMPGVLLGEQGDGLYDDLPYFLSDLAPQGFIGRQIAAEIAAQSDDFPTDPRYWNVDHIGRYLISNGDDLPGNFKFGQQAHLRVRRKPVAVNSDDYPVLADRVISGEVPGSSAGGEQPKFTAFSAERSAHVIVKFSPKGDSDVARRWRDILITEFYATEAIHAQDFPAAETRLIEADDRLFLESQRFDRSGEYGRMSMISLQSVDAEFIGLGSDWPQVLQALSQKSLVNGQHVFDGTFLWGFGRLINNTDMHLGNLSLAIEGNEFRLLPIYDMCSMGFAPKGGEVLPYDFTPPDLTALSGLMRQSIISMARDFWDRVANDDRVSEDFKAFLSNGNPLDQLKQ